MPTMASSSALWEVKQMGTDLLSSRAYINNLPALLALLSSSASPQECLLQALLSLQAFFLPLLRRGDLSSSVAASARRQLNEFNNFAPGTEEEEENPDKADAIYKSWLWDKYNVFLQILLQILSKEDSLPSIQAAALDALMEFTREEKGGKFSNRVYSKLCLTLVQSNHSNENVLGLLSSKYFEYFDVSYYTSVNLEKMMSVCYGRKFKGCEMFSDCITASTISEIFICNAYGILSQLKLPNLAGNDAMIWSRHLSEGGTEGKLKEQNDDNKPEFAAQLVHSVTFFECHSTVEQINCQKHFKKMKSAISKAWILFLRLPLPMDIYKKVLVKLHKIVIPCLTNPILLSDFLTNSYNIGGIVSVMALNGLFLLITQYGLEYPDFYNKLYALLEPSIFVAKYRARFFELVDMCLKSSHLPSYLAASFAKKLGRLALLAPPSGALVIIALIHNLLRRHPLINTLVHWQDSEEMLQEEEIDHVNKEEGIERKRGILGVDPFLAYEKDTAKCNALGSSLWEVETLRSHYCPAVSRFVASLETDLTIRSKTTEMAIKDFSLGSYATIIGEEVGRRMKRVPLSFYSSIPTSLFPEISPNELQLSGGNDFAGWKFQSEDKNKESPEVNNNELLNDNQHIQPKKKRIVTTN